MKKHIVLIDEDRNELKTFMDALEDVDGSFKCTYADSAEHALQMLQYLEPDFIFVDYQLPGIDELQLLSVARSEARLKDTKVFIYSQDITDEVNKMAVVLGASGCIEKPDAIAGLVSQFKAIFAGDTIGDYALLKRN